jgi:hypothetical protein
VLVGQVEPAGVVQIGVVVLGDDREEHALLAADAGVVHQVTRAPAASATASIAIAIMAAQ